jgi:hypothetical protein
VPALEYAILAATALVCALAKPGKATGLLSSGDFGNAAEAEKRH